LLASAVEADIILAAQVESERPGTLAELGIGDIVPLP